MRAPILLLSALAGFQLNAQNLEWGKTMLGDSPGQVYTTSTVAGPSGTVYSGGSITGTCNFDPGASDFIITEPAPSPFIVKRAADGQFLWARTFSSSLETHEGNIVVDAAGNSYMLGLHYGSLDCDPGAGTYVLQSGIARKYFLIKLDTDGNFVWAQEFGQLETLVTGAQLAIRGNNLYCAAVFSGTADFGDDELSTNDVSSMFVTKITTDGDFEWAVSFGASDNTFEAIEAVAGITTNVSGDVFLTGFFSMSGDFDPGAGVTTLTPEGDGDAFILKLNTDGDFQWAIASGREDREAGLGVALGPDGSVYQCGVNVTVNELSSANEDVFVARYSATGTEIWRHQIGGPYMEQGRGIDVDETGAIYAFGDHSSPAVDFDPGAGEFLMTANTSHGFILKLTADGQFVWAASFKSPVPDVVHPSSVVALDYANGMLYGCGYFFGALDLDPGADEYEVTSDNDYATGYVMKLDTSAVELGIHEAELIPFELYPNPFVSKATVVFEEEQSNLQISLLDLSGKVLKIFVFNGKECTIDVTEMSSGTYLLEVRQDNSRSVQRFIKV